MDIRRLTTEFGASGESGAVSRRTMLKRGGAIAGAAGMLGATQLAGLADSHSLDLDVACNGGTFKLNRSPGDTDAQAKRSDTFIVQGRIYPGGTIDQGLTGPGQAGSIGTWICRGTFLYDLEDIFDGAVPHVVTTQLYLMDNGDGLVSDGTEAGQYTVRAITGGYGIYLGARGSVSETEMGTNNTLNNLGGGALVPAPNLTFRFQLV